MGDAVTKKARDHTLVDLERAGRYEGDMRATLHFDPMTDSKRRWTVWVEVWKCDRYTAKGHREGYVDRDYWGTPHSIFDELTSKSFRTSERAIAYLTRVRGEADAHMVRLRLRDISNGQETRIA